MEVGLEDQGERGGKDGKRNRENFLSFSPSHSSPLSNDCMVYFFTDAPTVTSENTTLLNLHPEQAVSISCSFAGEPLPDITWSHNGFAMEREMATTVTTNTRSTLVVPEVTSETGGTYQCSARNSEGSSSAEFTVQSKPHLPHAG